MIKTLDMNGDRRPRRTRQTRKQGLAVLIAVFAALFTLSPAFAADTHQATQQFSKANRLLFMTDHLKNVNGPAILEYRFSRNDEGGDSFDDNIDITVLPSERRGKTAKINFLSGERHRYMPDIDNVHGNPVVMMFLQHDVAESAQHTGGSWRYFQRRIKLALEHAAHVTDEKADYDGQQIDVKRIYLAPFEHVQQHRKDLAGEVNKRYIFTLSDQVPGGVLEMRSEIPAIKDGREARVETLALKSVDNHPKVSGTSDDKPKS